MPQLTTSITVSCEDSKGTASLEVAASFRKHTRQSGLGRHFLHRLMQTPAEEPCCYSPDCLASVVAWMLVYDVG